MLYIEFNYSAEEQVDYFLDKKMHVIVKACAEHLDEQVYWANYRYVYDRTTGFDALDDSAPDPLCNKSIVLSTKGASKGLPPESLPESLKDKPYTALVLTDGNLSMSIDALIDIFIKTCLKALQLCEAEG